MTAPASRNLSPPPSDVRPRLLRAQFALAVTAPHIEVAAEVDRAVRGLYLDAANLLTVNGMKADAITERAVTTQTVT
jgi:hypothetical protein